MCPQDCQEWCASQMFLTGQSLPLRDNPPLECYVCLNELQVCVRMHMRVGVCVCARLRRKLSFVLLKKVETDYGKNILYRCSNHQIIKKLSGPLLVFSQKIPRQLTVLVPQTQHNHCMQCTHFFKTSHSPIRVLPCLHFRSEKGSKVNPGSPLGQP